MLIGKDQKILRFKTETISKKLGRAENSILTADIESVRCIIKQSWYFKDWILFFADRLILLTYKVNMKFMTAGK